MNAHIWGPVLAVAVPIVLIGVVMVFSVLFRAWESR